MKIYYELNNNYGRLPDGKYWNGSYQYSMMFKSDRVWSEADDSTIKLLKNRHSGDFTVDLKEFVWIKLKCKSF